MALWVSCLKHTLNNTHRMLTSTRNDLVKAVAAVNKNVIVVGECKAIFRRYVKNSH